MRIHTGEPGPTGTGYVGVDVHRAARISGAGHGGQVLLSQATRDLLGEQFPLRDLGAHRLKDLLAPERIYQLGEADFPPLKSLHQTNLPVTATPFLGRARELAEVTQLLAEKELRLLTLTGPGGTGKTRLALQAAAESGDAYRDGVFWVPLAPVRDPSLVLSTVSKMLSAKDELARSLWDKELLLLLDNFEHVVEAAPQLSTLLAECPSVSLLVTSRERLQLAAEHEYQVPPLSPPEGVELFTQRARAVGAMPSANGAVAELCNRLDNLPLALELAAARTKLFSPEQLLDRLGQRLDLLKGGRDADPRQQTLRATIEWRSSLFRRARSARQRSVMSWQLITSPAKRGSAIRFSTSSPKSRHSPSAWRNWRSMDPGGASGSADWSSRLPSAWAASGWTRSRRLAPTRLSSGKPSRWRAQIPASPYPSPCCFNLLLHAGLRIQSCSIAATLNPVTRRASRFTIC